jgi:uncharacterized protein (TIGR02466 family)
MDYLNIKDPWSPLVLQDHYPDFNWEVLKPKCDALLEESSIFTNSYLEQGAAQSTVQIRDPLKQPHAWRELDDFHSWLSPRIHEAIMSWRLTEQSYHILNSWVNKHDKGGWTDDHTHREIQFTTAIYLNVPEESGQILFRDPLEYHWAGEPSEFRGRDNGAWYPVNVKTGDVLLFPGWLPHKTEVSRSNESRYVMTFNYIGQLSFKSLSKR